MRAAPRGAQKPSRRLTLRGQHGCRISLSGTIVGLDANAPKVDHPDETQNVYWGDEYGFDFQRERLLFDRQRAPHKLEDVYRRFLEENARERDSILAARPPSGPLAVSHINLGRERRYDFLFTTPDIAVKNARYLSELLVARPRLSDHAPVVAGLSIPTLRASGQTPPRHRARTAPQKKARRGAQGPRPGISQPRPARQTPAVAGPLVLVWQRNPRPAVVHTDGSCPTLSRSKVPDPSIRYQGPGTAGWLPLVEARKLPNASFCRHCM